MLVGSVGWGGLKFPEQRWGLSERGPQLGLGVEYGERVGGRSRGSRKLQIAVGLGSGPEGLVPTVGRDCDCHVTVAQPRQSARESQRLIACCFLPSRTCAVAYPKKQPRHPAAGRDRAVPLGRFQLVLSLPLPAPVSLIFVILII